MRLVRSHIVYGLVFMLGLWIASAVLMTPTILSNELLLDDSLSRFSTHQSEPSAMSIKQEIVFVGDVMLARNVEHLMNTYGYLYPFLSLPQVASSSYLVGNFEASVPKIHIPTPNLGFAFSVQATHLQGLREYGFTHLGLANNHSYDHGAEDFHHTFSVLEHAQLNPFGDQRAQASSTIRILEVDDKKVALVGVYAVDTALPDGEIVTLLSRAQDVSDVQIAFVHWGTEYAPIHSAFQETLAKKLIEAGADAVIGHHPHVVQDIGIHNGKPIFYSLGNFIFDQYFSTAVQEGLVVALAFSGDESFFDLTPITSIGSRSSPRTMSLYEKQVFLTVLSQKSHTELASMITNGKIVISK